MELDAQAPHKYVKLVELINIDNKNLQVPEDLNHEYRYDTFEFLEVTAKKKEFWGKKQTKNQVTPKADNEENMSTVALDLSDGKTDKRLLEDIADPLPELYAV